MNFSTKESKLILYQIQTKLTSLQLRNPSLEKQIQPWAKLSKRKLQLQHLPPSLQKDNQLQIPALLEEETDQASSRRKS